MLYEKYIIDVICSVEILKDVTFQNNGNSFEIRKIPFFINDHKYLDNYGNLLSTPFKFYSHKQAMYYLEKYYNNIPYPQIPKIIEIYDNIEPPILILRQLKINKILKNKK